MSGPADDAWLRCSACRRELRFGRPHWTCSVSTCNRSRTRLVFCSVACWDSHVATLRHRDAWAVEERAPTREEWARQQAAEAVEAAEAAAVTAAPPARSAGEPAAPRRVVASPSAPAPAAPPLADAERDILVVVSKLKKYVKDRSGMNTSDNVAEVLSDHLRALCDEAIRAAGADGRKTVLDRDVPRPRR